VEKFALRFSAAYTPNNISMANKIQEDHLSMRSSYCELPVTEEHAFDTELVSSVISRLHSGKAPDVVGLSAEHLLHSHPSVSVILYIIFF